MTVSTNKIWKAATTAIRQPPVMRDKHLHIGKTLHDLYLQDEAPREHDAFSDLLSELENAEKSSKEDRRR